VEPPFAAAVANDEHYSALIKGLRGVAQQYRIPVVLRYDAMRYLAGLQSTSAEQHFRLHEVGRRCGPEYVAQAVAASLKARHPSAPDGSHPIRPPEASPAGDRP
jgi:hypothetical protein